jgi:acetoin utilization deacetylase AcuC-like enzyme
MRAFHTPAAAAHDPDRYFRRGTIITHPEQADRYAILLKAVSNAHEVEIAPDHGLDPILAAHDRGYIEFLRDGWDRRTELPHVDDEILSGHFARPHMHRRPTGMLGLIGYYMADTSTPIRAGTWKAIYGSAQVAVSAADAAIEDGLAYALCRPPGHHAYGDSAGGFCFLNNSAIAATRLLARSQQSGARVAILDIDVHHGNGTQGIFYERDDVLTVSIHADPSNYFPFYTGYSDETGSGAGKGFNLNIPLEHGLGDEAFVAAIRDGLSRIKEYAPAALVLALGLDASEHDPIGALKVTTNGFSLAAETIADIGLPTAIIQEGGYLCDALPKNLAAFLEAFEGARGASS